MSRIVTERQLITAGSQFNGAAPATVASVVGGVKTFPTSVVGGKIDCLYDTDHTSLSTLNRHRTVTTLAIQLADQASWLLEITNGVQDYTWLAGLTEVEVLVTDEVDLLPDQYLRLTTVGASLAMSVQVTFKARNYIG